MSVTGIGQQDGNVFRLQEQRAAQRSAVEGARGETEHDNDADDAVGGSGAITGIGRRFDRRG